MPAAMLRMIVVAAVCFTATALCRRRRTAASRVRRQFRATRLPYKANRLSTPRASEPILNIPGQTTVLTREVLDDMNATSVRDALRSTAGVTVGR